MKTELTNLHPATGEPDKSSPHHAGVKQNMGEKDRSNRFVIGTVLLLFWFTGIVHGAIAVVDVSVAGVLFLTSLIGICPLYWPFHIDTLKKEQIEEENDKNDKGVF